MNSARRSHHKTRTGCRNCKKRKIKCDEEKPVCKNCVKHSIRCDFLSAEQAFDARSRLASADQASINNSPVQDGDQLASPNASFWAAQRDGAPLPLSMQDLELLHNYSTSTCLTLSSNPLLRNCWRYSIPQFAFSHEFVMRSLLAISALHLAHFKHEKRDSYILQAVHHQQTALDEAMSILPHISKENCSSLYLFSAVTAIYALASPRKASDFLLVGESGIADWLYLLRGTRSIINTGEDTINTIRSEVCGPMIAAGVRRFELRSTSSGEENRLSELRHFVDEAVADRRTASVYAESINELQKSLAVAYDPTNKTYEPTDAFIWPFQLCDEYLDLLQQHAPEALAIFAFFCVLLKKLDSYWFLEGWSVHLLSRIHTLLDEEHRLWIQWPIEEVGWVPS